jgi:peptidoglycan/LPS O-acetylase OafA/YrhL
MAASRATQRLDYLDGLRGCAALLVVANHAIIAADAALLSGQVPDSRNQWDIWLSGTPYFPFDNTGNMAVCLFFILSGYVLTQSYLHAQQSWLALCVRRLVRLLIPMLAGCLLAWALLAGHAMRNLPAGAFTHSGWLTAQYLQQPDLRMALIEPFKDLANGMAAVGMTYDSSLWTMPIEAAGSLMLITLFTLYRYAGRHRRLLAGLALVVLMVSLHGGYLALFAAGGLWRLSGPQRGVKLWAAIPLLLVGIWLGTMPYSPAGWTIYHHMAAAVQPHLAASSIWSFSGPGLYHALGALLIMATVGSTAPLQHLLSQNGARRLGKMSFPLYVLHVPVIMAAECEILLLTHQYHISDGGGAILGVFGGIATALAVAALVSPVLEPAALTCAAWAGRAIDYCCENLQTVTHRIWAAGVHRWSRIFHEAVDRR